MCPGMCPVKKVYLKILQNSLKNNRAAVFTLISSKNQNSSTG